MKRNLFCLVGAAASAALLLTIPALPASAAAGDTGTTFTLSGTGFSVAV